VHAEAAVFAGTFQTDPDAVRHADPLWTVSTAVKTVLPTDTHDNISTDMSWLVNLPAKWKKKPLEIS